MNGPAWATGIAPTEISFGGAGSAKLMTSGINLARQLASEAQMTEGGVVIIRDLKIGGELASEYGGVATDWVKKSSSSF